MLALSIAAASAIAPSAFAVGAEGIYIPWVESFCGADTMILEAQVCNQAAQTRGFWVEFVDHGPFAGCTESVLPQHTFLSSLPLLLSPGECTTVQIEVTKPNELLSHQQVCYWLRFTPDIGGTITLGGYLNDTIDLCFDWWIAEPVVFLHPETPVIARFEARAGTDPTPFLYLLRAFADIDQVDADLVSIDGMPPGQFAFGESWIPEGETVTFEHTVEWLYDDTSRFIDLVVVNERDLLPLASIGLHQAIAAPVGVETGPLLPPAVRGTNLRVAPNPSRGLTAILWESDEPGPLRLQIYDAAGRHVRSLNPITRGPGAQRALWDGKDEAGAPVRAGTYWVRLPGVSTGASSNLLLLR
jgi:hypothetical protein